MRSIVEHEGIIAAKVLGTYEYSVRLWVEDDGLGYSCNCPLGVDGEFCKHCVAVGLAWLDDGSSEDAAVTMDDVRAYLEEQDKDVLVRIVIEQAMEDERLRERLLLRAARRGPGGLDLAAFRRAVDEAVDPGDFLDYGSPWDYARGIENVVASIAELLEEGFAAEAMEVSEYAIAAVEKAMDYDVDGSIGGILYDLGELHHSACKEAKPDPEALAARLFAWELGGEYDAFFEAVNTYADVLGEEGLAATGGSPRKSGRTSPSSDSTGRTRSATTAGGTASPTSCGSWRAGPATSKSWWPSRARISLAPRRTCG